MHSSSGQISNINTDLGLFEKCCDERDFYRDEENNINGVRCFKIKLMTDLAGNIFLLNFTKV